jgi:hypothetical protein
VNDFANITQTRYNDFTKILHFDHLPLTPPRDNVPRISFQQNIPARQSAASNQISDGGSNEHSTHFGRTRLVDANRVCANRATHRANRRANKRAGEFAHKRVQDLNATNCRTYARADKRAGREIRAAIELGRARVE